MSSLLCFLFFFNDTATTEIYTLSLHDALPIYFYTRDHVGSIREMFTGGGTVVARYDYDPYGRSTTVLGTTPRSEEHTSELQSHSDLVCRLLLEKKKKKNKKTTKNNIKHKRLQT